MKGKVIKSENGELSVPFQNVRSVCICYSIYPLLQFLLLMNEDMVKNHTCYFFGSEIPYNIRTKLPCFCYETRPARTFYEKIKRIIVKLKLRITRDFIYPFLKTAEFYAQDFGYLSILIGNQSYSMLQEAPNHLNFVGQKESFEFQRIKRKGESLNGKLESLFYGQISTHFHGYNSQCKRFFLTEKSNAIVLEDKDVCVDSLKSLWEQSEESKKKFILSVFDLNEEDKEILSSYPIIFLSQPWVNDCYIKEDDYVLLLKDVFDHYNTKELIVKCHPRDTFDYKKYFPDIQVFSKPISMQLLMLVAFKTKKVVTFTSSVVECFPENVEIDWFGTPTHKLIKKMNDMTFIYNRPYNKMDWRI